MMLSCLAPCGLEENENKDDGSRPSDLLNERQNGVNNNNNDDEKEDLLSEEDKGIYPVWLKDGETSLCFGCDAKFTSSFRKHHCRRCRSIYCKNCSAQKSHIVALKTVKPVRVCKKCYQTLLQENAYLTHEFPILQRGETFRTKQGYMSIFKSSNKFVCLRLMSNDHTFIYDDDSSDDPVQIQAKSITDIISSGFKSFDIVTASRTHTFEAENAEISKKWILILNNFMEVFHRQPLIEEVEIERQFMRKKCQEEAMKSKSSGAEEEFVVVDTLEDKRLSRKKQRDDLKTKYGLSKSHN